MKNYNVTYKNGHLIDTKTGKRIFLKRGGNFTLLGDDNQFKEENDLLFKIEPLSYSEKYEYLKNKHKNYRLKKIAGQGTVFVYRIGLSKKTEEDAGREFLFDAVLLEDLYMKSKINTQNKDIKWSLCDCICKTNKCMDGKLQIFEPIFGLSLSNLFSNMIAFYFPMQRSGACNAFKTFFFAKNNHHTLIDVERHQFKHSSDLKNIDDFRKKIKLE